MALVKGSGSTQTQEDRLKARGVGDRIDDTIVAGLVRPLTESPSSEGIFDKYDDPVITTPQRMIERFKGYEAMGVDHLVCLVAAGQPIDDVIDNMKMMAREVFPAFADSSH
jgi:hypothetical protein